MLGVAELLAMRGILTSKLPKPEVIDEVMYEGHRRGLLFSPSPPCWAPCGRPTPGRLLELGSEKPGR